MKNLHVFIQHLYIISTSVILELKEENITKYTLNITSKETPEISTTFKETSSKSLSGVEIRNSGSQSFKL